MRKAALLAALLALAFLALALTAPTPALAQPPLLGQAYQVRGAFGDIPTTAAAEPAGNWNLVQSLRVFHVQGAATNATFHVPDGYGVAAPGCSCPDFDSIPAGGGGVTVQVAPATPSGNVTVSLAATAEVGPAFSFTLLPPEGASPTDTVVILYVPVDREAVGPVEATSPGLSTDQQARILLFAGTPESPLPPTAVSPAAPAAAFVSFAVFPAAAVSPPSSTSIPAAPAGGQEARFAWMEFGLGGAAGAALGALLVGGRLPVRRARGTPPAAAAGREPRPVLEGRKRALLAALKEIDAAGESQQLSPEACEAVRADLKRQAVAVMRDLEAGEGAAPAEG